MSIINNILSVFKSKPKEEPLKLDPSLGDAVAAKFRAELAFGDYRNVQKFLEECRSFDERWFYIYTLSNWPGNPRWMDNWVEKEMRNSSIPWLIRGAQAIERAWELQSKGDKVFTVTQNEKAAFQQKLQRAEQDLQMAAWIDPSDPTPWAYLIKSGLGLYVGAKEIENRFKQACQRDPEHHFAHAFMLQAVSEKWGGLHVIMFDFARNIVSQAKEGSSLQVLIADAHIERWLFHLAEGEKTEAQNYFRKPENFREITKASLRSIQSMSYRKSKLTPFFQNTFAFCFSQSGNKTMARKEFQSIGRNLTEWPWSYLGDPLREFTSAREQCQEDSTK
ncbi:MAG: hypothetical protein HY819_04765 [Acidobacteria bacterium]|nr:hypothetical protein [Acidobacteriota bacterium]